MPVPLPTLAKSEYDATLKELLPQLSGRAFRLLTRAPPVVEWGNVEVSGIRAPRVEMLGRTRSGGIVHIELQSTNDPSMPLRMLEYALAIHRKHCRFPDQVVLYVGRKPLRMKASLTARGIRFHYKLIDLREIDGEKLLASHDLKDNVMAILARLDNPREAIRRILARIGQSGSGERRPAIQELGFLAGLRKLREVIDEEIADMPILEDIMEHDLLGPKIREGIAIGERQGREKGAREIVRRQIEKRFGRLPKWARQQLDSMSAAKIDSVALRVLDVKSLKELFN